MAQNPTMPMPITALVGRAKRGGLMASSAPPPSSASAGSRAVTPAAAAVRIRAVTRNSGSALIPAPAHSAPNSAPTMTPTDHRPCSPDMMDLPARRSIRTASAFIITSATPEIEP